MHDIDKVAEVLDRHHVPELLTGVICLGLGVLGATMLITPDEYGSNASFRVAFEWATPQAWGATLIGFCVVTLMALGLKRRDIYWPLLFIVGWLTTWCVALASAVLEPGTVPSGTVVYTLLNAVVAILGLSYMRESNKQ